MGDPKRNTVLRNAILSAILLLAASCASDFSRQRPAPGTIVVEGQCHQVRMSMKRVPGPTSNPLAFTVTVCTDGVVVWQESTFGWTQPRSIDRATPEQLDRLREAFAKAGFLDMPRDYLDGSCLHGSWYCEIYYYYDRTSRRVRWETGDESAPRALGALHNDVFEILEISRRAVGGSSPSPPGS